MANSLYPPIVDTYTPSFVAYYGTRENENGTQYSVRKGYCNIYFYLSPYNSKEEIKSIWVSIVNSATNKTVLAKQTEVYKTTADNMQMDPTSPPENPRYYIRLGASYLQGKTWDLDTLYKIQVRFCSQNFDNTSANINKYIDSFSEWSTATLVKPIPGYSTVIDKLGKHTSGNYYEFSAYQNLISGTVSYKDTGHNVDTGEYLESFRFKIYTAESSTWAAQELIYDSGVCYADDLEPNRFQHKLTQGLQTNKNYIFDFSFVSNNLFKHTKQFKVKVKDRSTGSLAAKIKAISEPDNGRIKLTITTPAGREYYAGNFIIRRSSSESNFTYWEDFKIIQINDSNKASRTEHVLYDYTVDSGIIYKYQFSKLYKTTETKSDTFTEPVLVVLEDMFINGEGRQLKIKFDPSISSYQHTLSESSTQTIGGKYPFIKRNGNLNYRQIGISGLVSYHMDGLEKYDFDVKDSRHSVSAGSNESLFTTKEILYNGSTAIYEQYNIDNRVSPERDFILERKFREDVTEFLLNGQPKLFRSPTEKAGIVRLMNVSMTPNAGLGRMLYSFSTTAHEIADCTLDNIAKYKINERGGFQQIRGNTLTALQATSSYNLTGPIDYYNDQTNNMSNILSNFKLTPSNLTVYNANIAYFQNVQISLYQNSTLTTAASPYSIEGADSIEPGLSETGETGSTQGFILYYEVYNPEMTPTLQSMVIPTNSYTFTSDTPITYLSYAVPQGRTIYAKITSDVVGYETVVEEGVGE